MTDGLKNKTGAALIWSFMDKGGQQLIQLLFMFVLIRLLEPSDFGLVAQLAIFTAVANILQESGFSSALIRKRKVSPREYSSVFYFNILVSVFIYTLLFLAAPYIADFYDSPALESLARFIFLAFIFNAFGIVQYVNLVKEMHFKTNTKITVISGLLAGVVAVSMAWNGITYWSLAVQIVLQAFIRNVLLWIYIQWTPKGGFSFNFIKKIMPYSSKLLLTSTMNQVCGNIYANIIGKEFSFSQAGLYDRGGKLNSISQSVISDGIKNVTFPLLADVDGKERRLRVLRKIVRITAFVSMPVALILIVAAPSLIPVLFGAKWNEAIPIVQILAIGGAFFPFYSLISTILQYEGKSGRLLGIETIRNALAMSAIPFTIGYGVLGLVSGISVVSIIAFLVGYFILGKVIEYGVSSVLKDIVPYMGLAILSYAPLHFATKFTENNYLLLAIQIGLGSIVYLGLSKMMKSKVLDDIVEFLKSKRG